MRTAQQIRNLYLVISGEKESKYVAKELGLIFNKRFGDDSRVPFTHLDDMQNAIEMAHRASIKQAALEVFCDIDPVEIRCASKSRIKHEIINRNEIQTMHSAAFAYVDSISIHDIQKIRQCIRSPRN